MPVFMSALLSVISPALPAAALSAGLLLSVADEVPTYNLTQSCRSETTTAASDQSCRADEQRAHDTLQEQWSRFAPGDKGNCLQVEKDGGAPSYVELLTCLQMAAAAKKFERN